MNVNASITDFPVFSQVETFFKKFKEAGVDGLELVLGVKSRFEYARIAYLSEKYDLPIKSIHQPMWSGVGLYFDESFAPFAKKLGVRHIVFHPLTFCSFDSRLMKKYFIRLAYLQEKYDICVMLENMNVHDFPYRKLFDTSPDANLHHMQRLNAIADEYGFLLTYDVSHAEIINPAKTEIFSTIFSKIGNIHISSFSLRKDKKSMIHHLPLTMGDFDVEDFVKCLQKKKYQGLLTMEIYYPKLKLIMNRYDFTAIANSVRVIKEAADK